MRKVELLPTRDCEAGYNPVKIVLISIDLGHVNMAISHMKGLATVSRRFYHIQTKRYPFHTRSSLDTTLLTSQYARTSIGDKSFCISGPSLWNSFPKNIREAHTLSASKEGFK